MTKQPINTRSSFSLVIYLFYEGETELDYLQKYIQQQRKTSVRLIKKCQSPNPQYLVDQAIKNFSETYLSEKFENIINNIILLSF